MPYEISHTIIDRRNIYQMNALSDVFGNYKDHLIKSLQTQK
jgi:hypothetical protein